MEQVQMEFRTGKGRRKNKAYTKFAWKVESLRKNYREIRDHQVDQTALAMIRKDIKLLKIKMGELKARDPMDQEYKRLWYCRYADCDFLIGVIGSKADAQGIMDRVKVFVQETLKLTIAEEKIRYQACVENTRFLGFESSGE